ncbi:MAG: tRNA lysidine(34) synthetase TilS [Rhodospirillales bacterium]|nr:tRNA lysidine(34) synthetase TilS [Rhodospirillales bacterium]
MTGAGTPVSPAAFAAAMARLGPFEPHPHVAVAWSGGGDSTALLALAREWAQERGGRVLALHVDHGLRANSADEARALAARAARTGIDFECLHWRGAKPATGIMDAARVARAHLLEAACAKAGIWHLLLGHHADDQRETASMRAARGSGPDGLAGMSAVVERTHVRLVRPLLSFAHADLLATCRARGHDWIEDPSNRDPRYARAALRNAGGAPDVPLAGHAASRIARERDLAEFLARTVALDPAGFARVDLAALATASSELACAALARIVLTVGGGEYAPRSARVEATLVRLTGAAARAGTLGHCRLVPGRDGRLVVARETAGLAPPVELVDGTAARWDGRFDVRLMRSRSGLSIGALGAAGWAGLPRETRAATAKAVPPAARASLPALRDLDGVVAVPHLFYGRMRYPLDTVEIRFRPRHALAGPLFADGA